MDNDLKLLEVEVHNTKYYLIDINKNIGGAKIMVDATSVIQEADDKDRLQGYRDRGPAMTAEIEKVKSYGKYLQNLTLTDGNLHEFDTSEYTLIMKV